jgi:hypothetical protein
MNHLLRFLPFLILATAMGCSDAPKYANIKGTVTFGGKPIEKGKITFAVAGRPPSTMDIEDGKFNGQAMVGENRVSVSMMKRVAKPPKLPKEAESMIKGYQYRAKAESGQDAGTVGEYDPSMVEVIPPEWGMQGKQTRVVESGSTNEFEFNIKDPNKN